MARRAILTIVKIQNIFNSMEIIIAKPNRSQKAWYDQKP